METFIFLPRGNALLYAEFYGNKSFKLNHDIEFPIRKVASRGVKESRYYRGMYERNARDTYNGKGSLLFSVSPGFYRGKINPDEAQVSQNGLEDHLGEDDRINTSDESVSAVAQEIRGQL